MPEAVTLSELLKPLRCGDAVVRGWIIDQIEDGGSRLALRGPLDRIVEIAVLAKDGSGKCMAATATYQLVVCSENHQVVSAEEAAAFRRVVEIIRNNDAGQPLFTPRPVGPKPESESDIHDPRASCANPREILLRMRSPCEMHCHFCDRGAGGPMADRRAAFPQLGVDYPELVRAARKEGRDWLTIGGDEPLTHPQVPEIVSTARQEGFERIVIYTSGLTLATPGVAVDLAARGVTHFELPIYGATAAVHDAVTGTPGSYERLWQTLDILRSHDIRFGLHCVVVRANLSQLPDLQRLVFERFQIQLRVDQAFSRGGDLADYRRYAPSFAEIRAITNGTEIRLNGFPVCIARAAMSAFEPPPFLPFWGPQGAEQHAHLPVCSPCRWKDRCPGPTRTYAEAYGDDGLNPLA